MATQRWKGTAAAVAQISTATPASPSVNDTFTVTCNGKSVSYQTAAGTVADVCNGLATALAGSAYPEFKEFVAQNLTTYIQLTANTVGKPFTVTLSVTTSGSATFTLATPTACTGPNFWTDPNNWSTGSAPVTGDDVFFDSGSVACLYGLSQSSVTLNSLNVLQAYTGTIGLPLFNSGGYYEYRTLELTIGATTINIGQGSGSGSGRIKLNVGSVQATLNVYNGGQPADQGVPTLLFRGTNTLNAVNVDKGQVGLGFYASDTVKVATLTMGYVTNQAGDAQVTLGGAGASNVTITTVTKNGGTLTYNCGSATTLSNYAGNTTVWTGGATTLNVFGGTVNYNSTGTIGTLNLSESGTIDFSQDQRAKTITNTVNRYSDASVFNDPFKVVGSLAILNSDCSDLSNLELGTGFTITRS